MYPNFSNEGVSRLPTSVTDIINKIYYEMFNFEGEKVTLGEVARVAALFTEYPISETVEAWRRIAGRSEPLFNAPFFNRLALSSRVSPDVARSILNVIRFVNR